MCLEYHHCLNLLDLKTSGWHFWYTFLTPHPHPLPSTHTENLTQKVDSSFFYMFSYSPIHPPPHPHPHPPPPPPPPLKILAQKKKTATKNKKICIKYHCMKHQALSSRLESKLFHFMGNSEKMLVKSNPSTKLNPLFKIPQSTTGIPESAKG